MSDRPTVKIDRRGRVTVAGPVRVEAADGTVAVSAEDMVAICICGRSETQPLAEAGHRCRPRP